MGEVIKMINGLDKEIKKAANIFLATKYCERLWYDGKNEDEMDEECGGIYLVHEDEDEMEYMSPFLELPITSPYILAQITCLEQFFKVVPETPILKTRQATLKPILSEWDGVIPEDVPPYKNTISVLFK